MVIRHGYILWLRYDPYLLDESCVIYFLEKKKKHKALVVHVGCMALS